MGGLNNGILDVHRLDRGAHSHPCGKGLQRVWKLYFIPCLTAGGPAAPIGVFEAVSKHVDRMSIYCSKFKLSSGHKICL